MFFVITTQYYSIKSNHNQNEIQIRRINEGEKNVNEKP